MNARSTLSVAAWLLLCSAPLVRGGDSEIASAKPERLNNLVSELLVASSISGASNEFSFARPRKGWIFVSAACQGQGTVRVTLDNLPPERALIDREGDAEQVAEAVRYVAAGEHKMRVECTGEARVDKLVVKSIPELIHCGLGFDSSIKSYGRYDLAFLAKDILPNITTLIVPSNLELPAAEIDAWHRQGKRFVAEVGINGQAETADQHFDFWTAFFEKRPYLDGILINEFIVNNPSNSEGGTLSPERQARMEREKAKYLVYEEAFKRMHADSRLKDKTIYAYVGGSGKRLNQEIIGKSFVRTLLDCDDRIALERYLFEVSSAQKSQDALQLFVDGIADWEAKEPGVKAQMIIAFGLFSMPPGGINKQPNVDYHVWMDQQMNTVANNPALANLGGLEWWTTILADEETVRFVGRLYRHYAIEGKTTMLTDDPLFLTHVQNADFESGTDSWTLKPADAGTIAARSFPRYGRIEGRYMGLGRPADPEHIGDTFLWMKRSEKGPNTFSQAIKNLTPGRLYSMKMFSCDYNDLVHAQKKELDQANKFIGRVTLDGVELDEKRSFTEMYASNPEPPIPVWITYFWKVFRARDTTARLTVSDWPDDAAPQDPFGQEQTFNFIEIEPYHE